MQDATACKSYKQIAGLSLKDLDRQIQQIGISVWTCDAASEE